MSLFDGPDGNMYVVDMYRGVVQAGGIWSAYLTDYIKSHDMELPVGTGRIWRVVYGNGRRGVRRAPALSKATPQQLVQTLSNPKGWWRDTAQRLLVERGDATVAPALKTLAASAPDWRTRLHALWTLDGLDAIDVASVRKALADANADVRAAGVRLSERWLAQDQALKARGDRARRTTRTGTCGGRWPRRSARCRPRIASRRRSTLLTRDGADPIIVDAAISSLKGCEADVLTRGDPGEDRPRRRAGRGGGDAGGGRREERRCRRRAAGDRRDRRRVAARSGSGRRCCKGLDAGLAGAGRGCGRRRARRARRWRRWPAGPERAGRPRGGDAGTWRRRCPANPPR